MTESTRESHEPFGNGADWEDLFWAYFSPESGSLKERATTELLRRAGNDEALVEIVKERAEFAQPVGSVRDWVPSRFRPGRPLPEDPVTLVEVVTENDSAYRIAMLASGDWYFSGANRRNKTSRVLSPDEWYRIGKPTPWPPLQGARLEMISPADQPIGDPDRCPGGGKVTSYIRVIRTILGAVQ